MPSLKVKLPDGSDLELPEGASGADAAAAIGPGLAKAALAVKQDGEERDLAAPLVADAPVEIVTDRSGQGALGDIVTARGGQPALPLPRHDAAHVFAEAMLELYPGVKISIGPPIEQGI